MASKKVAPTYTQILPIHYSNGDVLKAYLDQKCGGKPYTMSVRHPFPPITTPKPMLRLSKLRNNNWTITVSKKLSQVSVSHLWARYVTHGWDLGRN
jgi:hypothetical protein